MKRCSRCLMADTKPGLILDNNGICQACRHYELRKGTDYQKRFEELKNITEKYKRSDSYYDCLIAVSGGKDSHYQVHVMKELLGMNPLLVTAGDPFTKTETGRHNFRNIGNAFGCDIISLDMNPALVRKMVRIAFETFGSPTWPIDRAIYAFPIRMALNMKIPLVVYGENVSYEYGGVLQKESYSAKDQINNDVAKKLDFSLWYENGVSQKEINMLIYPSAEEIQKASLEPIYLSYFIPWDGRRNYRIAKKCGFRDLEHEWKREGYIEDYDQIDSIGYLSNVWMKYPKFGFARATDVVGYWIRGGYITKEEGTDLIKKHDHKLDQRILDDFLAFTGYSDKEYWDITEKFWNKDLFEKSDGEWVPKPVIYETLS